MPDSTWFTGRHFRQTGTALMLTTTVAMAGCSDLGVKPWERELLADPDMQLTVSGVDAGLDDHIYFSKEASSGGRGFGGGGCGCN